MLEDAAIGAPTRPMPQAATIHQPYVEPAPPMPLRKNHELTSGGCNGSAPGPLPPYSESQASLQDNSGKHEPIRSE